jgi:hypothetical protein
MMTSVGKGVGLYKVMAGYLKAYASGVAAHDIPKAK